MLQFQFHSWKESPWECLGYEKFVMMSILDKKFIMTWECVMTLTQGHMDKVIVTREKFKMFVLLGSNIRCSYLTLRFNWFNMRVCYDPERVSGSCMKSSSWEKSISDVFIFITNMFITWHKKPLWVWLIRSKVRDDITLLIQMEYILLELWHLYKKFQKLSFSCWWFCFGTCQNIALLNWYSP